MSYDLLVLDLFAKFKCPGEMLISVPEPASHEQGIAKPHIKEPEPCFVLEAFSHCHVGLKDVMHHLVISPVIEDLRPLVEKINDETFMFHCFI
jgi:hypothetical protein